jgi:hypothetical protein
MRNITFGMEEVGQSYWTYKQRSPGDPDSGPLYPVLNWIVEQLNLGNFEVAFDQDKEVVGITLGRDAIPKVSSKDVALKHARSRFMTMSLVAAFAKAREEGVEPQFDGLSKKVTNTATEQAKNNTELHYAHELVKVLERIRKWTFILSAPPIVGKVPEKLIWYLGEATRCFLYGLHRACIALCRACLEEALSVKVKGTKEGTATLSGYRQTHPKEGGLECLIAVANNMGYLEDDIWIKQAHKIRKRGNDILHSETVKEENSNETLRDLRGILEHLFSD